MNGVHIRVSVVALAAAVALSVALLGNTRPTRAAQDGTTGGAQQPNEDAPSDSAAGAGEADDGEPERDPNWRFPAVSFDAGTRLPNITLPDLDGNPRSLTEFQGTRVILHIFASW